MRYPGLLAADLTERERLKPMSGSLTVKLVGASDAEMTLPEDGPAVQIHDLVSLYTDKGLAGIFRVTNVAQNYKKQIDVSLLHAIDLLSDSVWADQTDFEGTRAQYITALLNQQTTLINGVKPWVLGTCHDTETVKKAINYDRLSDLLEEMEEDGGQYYFTYDFSTWPWTVNYLEKPQNTVCEFRLARNVRTATVTYNDADLCTRLHLSVNVEKTVGEGDNATTETETKIKTYNNTEAQAVWGIVVKTADIDTKDDLTQETLPEADAWAMAFLARRRDPSVQIQIDGDELKALTGDTWDEYSVGKKCQVALPDYGSTFTERVVSVTYPDLFKDTKHVTVSLANNLPRFSESLTDARKKADQAQKKATTVGRGAAKAKDLTTWSQIVSYQGAALDGTGVMTLWQSGIDMDAQGGVRIFSLQEGLQALYAGIEVTASQIRAEVSAGLSGMHSELLMTASQIKAEVDDSLSGIASFVIQADQIRSEVQDALSNLGTLVVESSQIRAEVRNALSDIAEFKVTASQIRAEVADALSRVATLEITSSQIRAEVSDALSNISTLIVESSQIRAEVTDALSNIATLVVESSQIRAEVLDALSNVASFVIDASQIRGEVADALSNVATLVIEADSIKAEVTDALSNVSALIVEASQIRAEVQDGLSNMAAFVVSANQIKAEVQNAMSQAASFVVEASQIRAAVSDAESRIASLEIAASAINISVSNAQSRLGAVEVQAGRVAMVVGSDNKIKAGVIVDAINDTSTALISADRITLDGNTQLNGVLSVQGGAMHVAVPAVFNNSVQIFGSNTLSTSNLQIVGGGQGERYNLTGSNVGNLITELQVASSNNVYYLQKKTVYNSSTWTDVASFNRGSAAVLTGAWDRSTHTYTVTAPGSTPVSTTVGMTGNGQQDSFTVSAFNDGLTTNVVNSINGYLVITSSSTRANNKAEVRLNAKTGTSSVLVSSVSLGDVYDKGAAAVTLAKSWGSNATFTVTPSNGGTPATTSVGLFPAGNGSSNFSVSIYRDGNTSNTVASSGVYLTEDTANKRVEAHWGGASCTVYGQISTTATYNQGAADVTLSKASSGNLLKVTASNGKYLNSYINLQPAGNGSDNFSVSAYYGTFGTDTTLITRNVYLEEDTANKTVKAHWNRADGSVYAQVSTAATYNAGVNAVTLSRAISGNRITVNASNGKSSNTYVNLTPSGNGSDNFTVSAYYGTDTANTLISRYVYLTANASTTRANNKVQARWNSATGTVYGEISTVDTYDKGAASVTLSEAWNGAKYTVTSSNSKTKSTTIGLTASGNGTESFTVSAYHDSTSSTVKSEYIYLVDNSSQKRVEAHWGSATGTVYGQIGYTSTSHSISVSSVSAQPGSASTSGRTNAKSGGISRPPANGYVFFTVSCGGTSKSYYIPINT